MKKTLQSRALRREVSKQLHMKRYVLVFLSLIGLVFSTHGKAIEVMITPDMASVDVIYEERRITIRRNQDRKNKVKSYYSYTSRRCPPFCIQPISAAAGVQTVGELEVIDYLKKVSKGDHSLLVIDARTPQWPRRGMIPGAVNIPWTMLDFEHSDAKSVARLMEERLGVSYSEGEIDFSNAKTLILYCNGMWCAQSTRSINALMAMGYPPERLKWYRGGMQAWEMLGLTTVEAGK
ncbi:MAG: rhodanese-like domain-containing protein [Pseudomonadota bacterium]